jgi:hypothetical protein
MRADGGTTVALDAQVRLPDRNFRGNGASFQLAGAGGPGAVRSKGADWQAVAMTFQQQSGDTTRKVVRVGGTIGRKPRVLLVRSGSVTSLRPARAPSMAALLRRITSAPRLPQTSATDCLIRANAVSSGRTLAKAKKQTCMTVLMRPPRPAASAMREASMTNRRPRFAPAAWSETHAAGSPRPRPRRPGYSARP